MVSSSWRIVAGIFGTGKTGVANFETASLPGLVPVLWNGIKMLGWPCMESEKESCVSS
jgi:hypothetical protein